MAKKRNNRMPLRKGKNPNKMITMPMNNMLQQPNNVRQINNVSELRGEILRTQRGTCQKLENSKIRFTSFVFNSTALNMLYALKKIHIIPAFLRSSSAFSISVHRSMNSNSVSCSLAQHSCSISRFVSLSWQSHCRRICFARLVWQKLWIKMSSGDVK